MCRSKIEGTADAKTGVCLECSRVRLEAAISEV